MPVRGSEKGKDGNDELKNFLRKKKEKLALFSPHY